MARYMGFLQELKEKVNACPDADWKEHCRKTAYNLLKFLEDHVNEHFEEEETLMSEAQFEEFDEHQYYHNIFRSKIKQIRQFTRASQQARA